MKCHWGFSRLSCWSLLGSRHFLGLPPSLPHFGAPQVQADGTLGVVTKVNLKLRLPSPPRRAGTGLYRELHGWDSGFVDDCTATFAFLGQLGAALSLPRGPLHLHLREKLAGPRIGAGVALLRGEGKGHLSPSPCPHLPPEVRSIVGLLRLGC